MSTPRWLIRARRIRDDILETDAAIRQIVGDRADRASFEGNFIERLKLDALEKERARLSWRLTQALARGAGLDPYAVDEVTRRRLILAAFGTGLSLSGGGATPETPLTPRNPLHPVHPGAHYRYMGWSANRTVTRSELANAQRFTGDALTIPDGGPGYPFFAVEAAVGYPDSLHYGSSNINELPSYDRQPGTLAVKGAEYVVGIGGAELSEDAEGVTVTLGYAP